MFNETDVIYSYSRAQAITDGVLIDVTETAKEVGFRYPTALTRVVWSKYVAVPEEVGGQDEVGRLWDILSKLWWAIRERAVSPAPKNKPGELLFVGVGVKDDNRKPELVNLKAVCGPNDDLTPCLTVMLPTED